MSASHAIDLGKALVTHLELDESEQRVEMISDPIDDKELTDLLTRQAQERFPEEYDRILRKYGAVEYIWELEPFPVVTGLAEPKAYMQKSDELNLERFGQGLHNPSAIQRVLTSTGLVRIATSQLLRAIAKWDRYKTEPEHLYASVHRRSRTISSLWPDKITGQAKTQAELLARPRFVGMSVRYILQQALCDVAHWSKILEYLCLIEEMDEKHGRFGMRQERGQLMAQVKIVMDSIQQSALRGFSRALAFHPDVRPTVVHAEDYADFGGGMIEHNCSLYPDFAKALRDRGTLKGAFARYLARAYGEEGTDDYITDISGALSQASSEEQAKLSPDILDAWAEVELITYIVFMLGTDGEDWRNTSADARLRAHHDDIEKVIDSFETAAIDKYTKSADSLKSEGAFRKIWAELNRAIMKKAKKPFEEAVTFTRVTPSWTHSPEALSAGTSFVQVDSKLETEEAEEAIPPLTKTQRKKIKKQEKLLARQAEEKLAAEQSTRKACDSAQEIVRPATTEAKATNVPLYSEPYVVPDIPETVPQPIVPKELKVKTRGTVDPSIVSATDQAQEDTTQVAGPSHVRAIYRIGKCYETMERLLVRNQGSMDWVDFDKLMTTVGFRKIPTSGSIIVYKPPTFAKSRPIVIHRPHESEISPIKLLRIRSALIRHYGWTIDWFSDAKPDWTSGQEEDLTP